MDEEINKDKKPKQSKKATIWKLLFSCAIIGLIIGLAAWGYFALGLNKLTQEELQDYIAKTGAVAPLVYIAICFLQVTFIPLPATVVIVPGSFLFGPWLAFLYSYIGVILGSLFAFLLGKIIGRPFINWIAGDKETVDSYLLRMKGKERVVLFLMFLFPFFPDDLLCSVAGILPISWLWFFNVQLLTRISSIAGTIFTFSGTILPYDTWWGITIIVILCLICIVMFIYSFKYGDKIDKWFDNMVNKLISKFKKNKKEPENKEVTSVETNENSTLEKEEAETEDKELNETKKE